MDIDGPFSEAYFSWYQPLSEQGWEIFSIAIPPTVEGKKVSFPFYTGLLHKFIKLFNNLIWGFNTGKGFPMRYVIRPPNGFG